MITSALKTFFAWLLFVCVANLAVAAPRIACDAPEYDFGTVSDQNTITREFTIWNRGDSDLRKKGQPAHKKGSARTLNHFDD
jgi:hypothetical protein